MYTISTQDLKNVMKVATETGDPAELSASLENTKRKISIICRYHPHHDPGKDLFPYWYIHLREEDTHEAVYVKAGDLQKVRTIYKNFLSQINSDQSYLDSKPVEICE